MTKKTILLLVLTTLITWFAFAGGSFENAILYQPTNVPNNGGVLIELSEQKAETESSFSNSWTNIYQPSFSSNLPLFCIVDTLDSSKAENQNNVKMTISSPYSDGFYFVMDGNETKKVPFTLDAFIIEFNLNKVDYWSAAPDYRVTSNKKKFSGTINVNGSKQTSFTESVVASHKTYTLSVPPTNYQSGNVQLIGTYYYPKYPRYYYICINIPGANNLEDGEYTATLILNCERMGLIEEEIQIKGYVGEKPVDVQSGDYSFFINNGKDTFFANLEVKSGETSPPLEIATLQLFYTEPFSSYEDPTEQERGGRFKIYISPTSTYSDNGKYTFKRTGTENQEDSFGNRIYYELDTTSTTGLTKYNNNVNNNTYYLLTDYSNIKTQDAVIGKDKYQETWKLDGKHIYIQVAEESKETINPPEGEEPEVHQTGTYYSYMYFTVESTF